MFNIYGNTIKISDGRIFKKLNNGFWVDTKSGVSINQIQLNNLIYSSEFYGIPEGGKGKGKNIYPIFVNAGPANFNVIMNNGDIISWGSNQHGQMTNINCLQQIDPKIQIKISGVCGYGLSGYTSVKFSNSSLKPIKIDTSDTYTAVLFNNQKIYFFGELLKNGTATENDCKFLYDLSTVYPDVKFKDFSSSAGFNRFAAIKENGHLVVWKITDTLTGTGGFTLNSGAYLEGWDEDINTLERINYYNSNTGATHSYHNYKFKYVESGETTLIGILENDQVYTDSSTILDNYGYSGIDSLYNPWLENTFGISSGTVTNYFKSVSNSQAFNAGVSMDGTPVIWGSPDILNGLTLLPQAWSVRGITAKAVDCGVVEVCWLMSDGTVECRPSNSDLYTKMPSGMSLNPSFNIVQLSVGDKTAIALSSDKKVYTWGVNRGFAKFGQQSGNVRDVTVFTPDIFK